MSFSTKQAQHESLKSAFDRLFSKPPSDFNVLALGVARRGSKGAASPTLRRRGGQFFSRSCAGIGKKGR